MRIFKQQWPLLLLFLCIALHAALTASFSITLYYELKTSAYDGTVYQQLMQNVIDGHGLRSSINPPYASQHWLGFHFSPILYLLVPFYALYPHIETLLVSGSVLVALGALPIFLSARIILGNATQGLLVALLYLINPFVTNGILWDFHEIDFAPLVLGFMLWSVVTQKRGLLLALSFVLLGIKEHYGLSVFGFGLLWAWHWRSDKSEKRFGFILAVFGLSAAAVIIKIAIPYFNPTGKPMMMDTHSSVDRFSWLTSSDGIKAHAIPVLSDALWYAVKIIGPLLFLPLLALPWLLPAIADAATNSLSMVYMMRLVYSYHSIALLPVVLVASCYGIRNATRWQKRFSANDLIMAILALSACSGYLQLALPYSETSNVWEFTRPRFSYAPEDKKAIDDINALIPKDTPVGAQLNILPHLAVRQFMYPFPPLYSDMRYIALKFDLPYRHAVDIMGSPFGTVQAAYFASADQLLHDKSWAVVYSSGRWVVLMRGGKDNAQAHRQAEEALESLRKEFADVRESIGTSYRRQ